MAKNQNYMLLYLRNIAVFFLITIVFLKNVSAQSDTSSIKTFENTVQDIMKQPLGKKLQQEIVSASKKAENIFDAPVAASVITRTEILQSGALSIMEALRLLPGVIVRETTTGNYDINLRGFNNTPAGSDLYSADNSRTLVMIDNRPIFNYFSGGTFWEALPIDINDVERIELIRGPAAALYGSNAVTGVIHIISRKINKEGFYTSGNVEYGSMKTMRASTSAGYAPNSKFQLLGSFNYTKRDRATQDFYSFVGQKYVNFLTDKLASFQTGSIIGGRTDLLRKYAQPSNSIDRYGANVFLNYSPNSDIDIDLAVGIENSYAIRPFAENSFTPLSSMYSNTKYLNLKSRLKQGSIQASYLFGNQTPGVETVGAQFDFGVLDIQSEYNFNLKNLNIRPGFSFKETSYDDSKYFSNTDIRNESGLLNGKKTISILSPSIRLDYTLKNLRLVAAGRLDKFNVPDKAYLAYQFAATYKVNNKHIFRVLYGQANRGAFFTETYASYRDGRSQLAPNIFLQTLLKGNQELKLLTSNSFEIGYRFQIDEKLSLDLEAFRSTAKDYTSPILSIDTVFSATGVVINPTFTQTNLKARSIQTAITLNINYNFSNKLQSRAFLTIQKTDIFDSSPFNIDPKIDPTGVSNYLIVSDINGYKGTPSAYGGFYLNYSANKFNLNVNGYYFGRQELTHISDVILGRASTIAEIKAKLNLNCKITFQPIKQFKIYVNMRNILGMDSYEYLFTDRVGSVLSTGLNYEF